ncbi:MAG: molybdate ABC transporter substrate-binding protein [Aeromicrobium sp.]
MVVSRMLATAGAGLLVAALAGCGSVPKTLTVYAAASLQDSFTEIGSEFEAANPGVTVAFNFDGSANLVAQLQQGAPADVFAAADVKNMTKATTDDLIEGKPVAFATNVLQIVTPPDNPAAITSIDDLDAPAVNVVLCAPQVPCGSAALAVEKTAGIDITPVSEEQSVTDVLNKVRTGEADAGLVYVTDVRAAGDAVTGIGLPEGAQTVNTYPIAALSGSTRPDLAAAFVAFVSGTSGQSVLRARGFGPP